MRGATLALFAVLALAPAAHADVGSKAGPYKHIDPVAAARFSKQIEKDLASHGARLALVFRAGRPHKDMPRGTAYTHGAFWAYQPAKATDGHIVNGYAVYNLYQGDGKKAPKDLGRLEQDFPLDFTSGSTEDDVAVILPTPEMQRRILAVMASPTYRKMFNPSYSLIGNPFKGMHQNCDDFVLSVVAAAAWQTDDPKQVRANLKAHFKPSVIEVNSLQRFFGPMVDDGIKTDDQHGPIVTAAYESIARFMMDNKLADATYVIRRQN